MFPHCVTLLVAEAMQGTSPRDSVLGEPLTGYLHTLAERQGYQGENGDLDRLKGYSTALKTDPNGNMAAIAALDDAIASYAGELRIAVSVTRLAASEKPGTDIYPQLIKQELDFFRSDRAKFYDKGPFELTIRGLYAAALEGDFFLRKATDMQQLQERSVS